MDFSLSNEQRHWQMTARKFADEEIRPISLERDAIAEPRETFDWDIIKKGSKLGFRTMAVPKEWGGQGTDFVTQALVMTELARGDSAISKTFSQNWKWSHLISATCTEEQKERAERHGDEWILNGEKCFIANAPVGKLFFIDARTNPNVTLREGTTMFLVPRDTPGFRIGKVFNKNGWRFYQNGEMIFENARVPHANVVGLVNASDVKSKLAGDRSGGDIFGDLELAANALGVCLEACDQAIRHARSAKQGGKILFEQQIVQLKLNKMHMLTEALRSFVMRVAWEHDQKLTSNCAGLAMNFSSDVIHEVAELNLEIHGAAGGVVNKAVEKLVRDALIWTHLAGDNVQRMKAARRLGR